ncbi:MAG: hypothetical protein M3P96_05045 [Actinomycetota bacterium]|nr:hypothetical protein [Actinomycetota bacterium]
MAGLLRKLTEFARSPKGQQLIAEAQRRAKDPETRRKLQELRQGRRRGR